MTGLILKDLLYLKRTGRVLIAVTAFYLIVFLATSSGNAASAILSGFIVMLPVILSVNVFACDEFARWRRYEGSLPVSGSRVVLARYLFALIFSTSLTLLSFALELFVGLTQKAALAFLVSWGAALLFYAVLFPIFYRFGTQKARLVLIGVVLLPTFGVALLRQMNLPLPGGADPERWLPLLPLLAAALFLLSFRFSCRVFARRED
ncbi:MULTISPECIES: ABC-2 transporter permease [Acutalibacteraceae]|uniref:ABC-2 transporter permease n=1 Tax=Acutalibacteraceae TaxID=3082771 RepID=UPI0013E8E252|nr:MULTISPECIES: ABC-2 transporter permease [Acutalibacteraceae]